MWAGPLASDRFWAGERLRRAEEADALQRWIAEQPYKQLTAGQQQAGEQWGSISPSQKIGFDIAERHASAAERSAATEEARQKGTERLGWAGFLQNAFQHLIPSGGAQLQAGLQKTEGAAGRDLQRELFGSLSPKDAAALNQQQYQDQMNQIRTTTDMIRAYSDLARVGALDEENVDRLNRQLRGFTSNAMTPGTPPAPYAPFMYQQPGAPPVQPGLEPPRIALPPSAIGAPAGFPGVPSMLPAPQGPGGMLPINMPRLPAAVVPPPPAELEYTPLGANINKGIIDAVNQAGASALGRIEAKPTGPKTRKESTTLIAALGGALARQFVSDEQNITATDSPEGAGLKTLADRIAQQNKVPAQALYEAARKALRDMARNRTVFQDLDAAFGLTPGKQEYQNIPMSL